VRLEWQSWHERFRILAIFGLIISVDCGLGAGVLETPGVGTNCIPIKTEPSKTGMSFASLRMIRYFMLARYDDWSHGLVMLRS